jgi:hypothetical protein
MLRSSVLEHRGELISNLKLVTKTCCEKFVTMFQFARCHNPAGRDLNFHRRENLKSNLTMIINMFNFFHKQG